MAPVPESLKKASNKDKAIAALKEVMGESYEKLVEIRYNDIMETAATNLRTDAEYEHWGNIQEKLRESLQVTYDRENAKLVLSLNEHPTDTPEGKAISEGLAEFYKDTLTSQSREFEKDNGTPEWKAQMEAATKLVLINIDSSSADNGALNPYINQQIRDKAVKTHSDNLKKIEAALSPDQKLEYGGIAAEIEAQVKAQEAIREKLPQALRPYHRLPSWIRYQADDMMNKYPAETGGKGKAGDNRELVKAYADAQQEKIKYFSAMQPILLKGANEARLSEKKTVQAITYLRDDVYGIDSHYNNWRLKEDAFQHNSIPLVPATARKRNAEAAVMGFGMLGQEKNQRNLEIEVPRLPELKAKTPDQPRMK